jgi:hypothetical protein
MLRDVPVGAFAPAAARAVWYMGRQALIATLQVPAGVMPMCVNAACVGSRWRIARGNIMETRAERRAACLRSTRVA